MPIDKNEIESMVWEKFPYSEAEKRCATERSTMNQLRQNYRHKLYKQYQQEQEELLNERNSQHTL